MDIFAEDLFVVDLLIVDPFGRGPFCRGHFVLDYLSWKRVNVQYERTLPIRQSEHRGRYQRFLQNEE
ncbi:hypothetical protein M513_11993 [Trichuris suis]|uniref:Uncharacterized protein n=1 Tax=Trichuris suis TaxID=68888 RepID=A0A085LQ97_9BILA|nr:hypothetical protein M513_11993 [Trichuris suis]